MNKTIAALAIAGLSFSSVAKGETYLVLDDEGAPTKLHQITIDLTEDDAVGTQVVTSLATGKRAKSSSITRADAEELIADAAAATAIEFNDDGYSVAHIVAAIPPNGSLRKAIDREIVRVASKVRAAEKALAAAQSNQSKALAAWGDLVGVDNNVLRVALTDAPINAWSILVNSTGETVVDNRDNQAEAIGQMDASVGEAYVTLYNAEDNVKSITETIRLRTAAIAKAKAAKQSTLALAQGLLAFNEELEEANIALADAKVALSDAIATSNGNSKDLSVEEKAARTAAEAELKALRVEYIALPAKILAAQTAGLAAKVASDKASDALAAIQVAVWKYTHSDISVSQADDDNSIIVLVQTPDGKVGTYSGPGMTAASPMFAIAARSGYVVSQFEEGDILVNGVSAAESEVGTATAKQSFMVDGALDLFYVDGSPEDKPDAIARVKNGKIMLNAPKASITTQDDPETTDENEEVVSYVLDNKKALKHGLILKNGLLSGKWIDNKESVTGSAGNFGGVNKAYYNDEVIAGADAGAEEPPAVPAE